MLWSKIDPPIYQPDAVLTKHGWVHPTTGEILVAMHIESLGPGVDIKQSQTGVASIRRTTVQHQFCTFRIVCPTSTTKQVTTTGKARIVCPTPPDTGINSSW